MKQFFKFFAASLLALFVFSFLSFVITIIMMVALASIPSKEADIPKNSVLVLDLSNPIAEQSKEDFNFSFTGSIATQKSMGLYDIVRMIAYAKEDKRIKGIYIKAGDNVNGFATSYEIRKALQDFKSSKKFIVAYHPTISQKAYYVASVADKIYTHPQGGVSWNGLISQIMFFKGTLDKLEIQPQIFFAGKYKSATEPFRVTQMTDANRVQTTQWLESLYATMLADIAPDRNIDTAALRSLANTGVIKTAEDALKYQMVNSLMYNDELQSELRKRIGVDEKESISLLSFDKYAGDDSYKKQNEKGEQIALVYAEGSIMPSGDKSKMITSEEYVSLLRKIRLNEDIKAVVLRVNSPGGSALASDEIWREITLIKKTKPVVVSMGDVAASGGYYISCAANRIFADPNTITGSIGVFSMLGNMQQFFKNKLGITFDAVKTGAYADLGTLSRPMTDMEKQFIQAGVDSVYHTFKLRVATGRNRSIAYIDSIAQGRVWSGVDAKRIGLVDELGSLNDAVQYAAQLIKAKEYRLKEYPAAPTLLSKILNVMGNKEDNMDSRWAQFFGGAEGAMLWNNLKLMQQANHHPQAALPYTFDIH